MKISQENHGLTCPERERRCIPLLRPLFWENQRPQKGGTHLANPCAWQPFKGATSLTKRGFTCKVQRLAISLSGGGGRCSVKRRRPREALSYNRAEEQLDLDYFWSTALPIKQRPLARSNDAHDAWRPFDPCTIYARVLPSVSGLDVIGWSSKSLSWSSSRSSGNEQKKPHSSCVDVKFRYGEWNANLNLHICWYFCFRCACISYCRLSPFNVDLGAKGWVMLRGYLSSSLVGDVEGRKFYFTNNRFMKVHHGT